MVHHPAIQYLIGRAGKAYTAGPAVGHGESVCRRLGTEGIASTLSYWNAFFDDPGTVKESYLRAIAVIRRLASDCYLSVKAPAFGFNFELLKQILDEAARTQIRVHFDSLAPETVDRTFELIDKARRRYPHIGCTLPARWRRSFLDVDRVADLGLSVRLVKGQWAGPAGDETNPHEGFRSLVDRLALKGVQYAAVATHHPEVANECLRRFKSGGISCELELLHGLPQQEMLNIARQHNVPVRVYVPYGHPALPYRLREARRDPRILGWFARDLIRRNGR
jgi:proline dehydrogenase